VKGRVKVPEFQTEAQFEEWARARLKEIPVSYWLPKFDSFRKRGLPDIVGNVNGYFVAIELKLDGAAKDPSRESLQEYEIAKIASAGAVLAMSRVTPSSWNEVEEFIYGLIPEPTLQN
jgi:hypothetical protein